MIYISIIMKYDNPVTVYIVYFHTEPSYQYNQENPDNLCLLTHMQTDLH